MYLVMLAARVLIEVIQQTVLHYFVVYRPQPLGGTCLTSRVNLVNAGCCLTAAA